MIIKNPMEHTFTLIKPEAYLTGKVAFIEQRLHDSGLEQTGRFRVKLMFSDVFKIYPGWQARVATLLRLPPLFEQDVICFKGENAIHRLNQLKYRIRAEIWGFEYQKGGYLHVPDNHREVELHRKILSRRIITGDNVAQMPGFNR